MGIYDGLLRVYRNLRLVHMNLRLVHMNLRLVHMNLRLVHMNALCFSSIMMKMTMMVMMEISKMNCVKQSSNFRFISMEFQVISNFIWLRSSFAFICWLVWCCKECSFIWSWFQFKSCRIVCLKGLRRPYHGGVFLNNIKQLGNFGTC